MFNIIGAVIRKNRLIIKRAYPWSFIWSRISSALFSLAVPLFLYYLVFDKNVSNIYLKYANGCSYLNYIMLGEVLNVLSFSTFSHVLESIH